MSSSQRLYTLPNAFNYEGSSARFSDIKFITDKILEPTDEVETNDDELAIVDNEKPFSKKSVRVSIDIPTDFPSENDFVKEKHHMPTIKCRNGKQIHKGQCYRKKCSKIPEPEPIPCW